MFETKPTSKLLVVLGVVIALVLLISPMIGFGEVKSAPSIGAYDALRFMSDDGDNSGESGGDEGEDDDDDNSGPGNADDDDEDNAGPGRGNCEKGKKGEDKGKGEKKGHKKCDEDDNIANPVAQAQLYLVAVACQFQNEANATTCLFVGGTERGTADVTRVSIPADVACTEVTDGTFASVAEDGIGQALASQDGSQAVTLIFEGRVRTSGEASYRVATRNGLFPATGPGLQCGEATNVSAPTDLSATTGAIRVIAYDCPAGVDPATVDWFATCATPTSGVTFRLLQNGVSSDSAKTGVTDETGSLTFENLPVGTYHLTEDDGNWCHAESDSVDEAGEVIVRANERSTVWIFHCPAAVSS